jgi:hypothetical protein
MNNSTYFNTKTFSGARVQERSALVDTFREAIEEAIEKCTYPTIEIEKIEFHQADFADINDEYYGMCGY